MTLVEFQFKSQDPPQANDQPHAQVDVKSGDFTCFPRLPLELQRKIWSYAAIPQSRAIQIETKSDRDAEGNLTGLYNFSYQSATKCSPTSLLGVCHESRTIALQNYPYSEFLDRPLFYNPDIDILWARGDPLSRLYETHGVHNPHASMESFRSSFWRRRYDSSGPYQFRSIAIDFAGMREYQRLAALRPTDVYPHAQFVKFFGLTRMEVEKVYIVYSSLDRRDDVDAQVDKMAHTLQMIAEPHRNKPLLQNNLKDRNERDGTNLPDWKIPSVEAILDTRLLNPIETFPNFPNLPIELQRQIWNHAAIPYHRAIEVETVLDPRQSALQLDGYHIVHYFDRVTANCYPTALFETCNESRNIAMAKYKRIELCERNSGRFIYYSEDRDIFWLKGDLMHLSVREQRSDQRVALDPTYFRGHFANMAVDLDHFISNSEDELFRGKFILALGRSRNIALKKVFLVYSEPGQKERAFEEVNLILEELKDSLDLIPGFQHVVMRGKGIGETWEWPVFEPILQTDIFQITKGWRKDIILKEEYGCADNERSYQAMIAGSRSIG